MYLLNITTTPTNLTCFTSLPRKHAEGSTDEAKSSMPTVGSKSLTREGIILLSIGCVATVVFLIVVFWLFRNRTFSKLLKKEQAIPTMHPPSGHQRTARQPWNYSRATDGNLDQASALEHGVQPHTEHNSTNVLPRPQGNRFHIKVNHFPKNKPYTERQVSVLPKHFDRPLELRPEKLAQTLSQQEEIPSPENTPVIFKFWGVKLDPELVENARPSFVENVAVMVDGVDNGRVVPIPTVVLSRRATREGDSENSSELEPTQERRA